MKSVLLYVVFKVSLSGWTQFCGEYWVSGTDFPIIEYHCVTRKGKCLEDTRNCDKSNRRCPSRFYSGTEGFGSAVHSCDSPVCKDTTNIYDRQLITPNSEVCNFHGTCSASKTQHDFNCDCDNVNGFTGLPTAGSDQGTCNMCLNSDDFNYPRCNIYEKYKECIPKASEHESCQTIATADDCLKLSSVSLETNGTSMNGHQPFWYLCRRQCGYCQINNLFESFCPTGPVTRLDLIKDIHGVDDEYDSDSFKCTGLNTFLKRSDQNDCKLDTSQITDFSNLFKNCQSNDLNYNIIKSWDVSTATRFDNMFLNVNIKDIDLNSWDVSNAVNMYSMFKKSLFSGTIDKWDVSKVNTLDFIFAETQFFDSDLRQWNFQSYDVSISDFLFSNDAADRPFRYKNLHALDFYLQTAPIIIPKTFTPFLKLDTPPCWISYDATTNEATIDECNSGIAKKQCECTFAPYNAECTASVLNSLDLKCSTSAEAAQAVHQIRTMCPDLNQGSTNSADSADAIVTSCSDSSNSNCYFKCNPNIYDVSSCPIDFSNSTTANIHAEYTCTGGKVNVPDNDRILEASNYCQTTCTRKQFDEIDIAAHMCRYRPDCVGIQAENNCGATIAKVDDLQLQANTNYKLCTAFTSGTCTGANDTCVLDYSEVLTVDISHLTTTTTTFTVTETTKTTTTVTSSSTTLTFTSELGPIETINFDALPTKKSVGPVVVLSVLFVVVLIASIASLFIKK